MKPEPVPDLSPEESAQLRSLAEQVRMTLEDEIAAGILPPGARLDEIQLSKRFEVSRTPIREALKQLGAHGLVARGPRRTQMVAQIPPVELDQLFELMSEMEAMCGRLAAINMTPRERIELERCQIACRNAARSSHYATYAEADAVFHGAIYAGTHNIYAIETADKIRKRLAPFRRLQLLTGERLVDSQAEHEGILTAILQGNAPIAASLSRDHIIAVRDSFSISSSRPRSYRVG